VDLYTDFLLLLSPDSQGILRFETLTPFIHSPEMSLFVLITLRYHINTKYTVWENAKFLNVKIDGTHNNHYAIKG
jgi:hypothetical protein